MTKHVLALAAVVGCGGASGEKQAVSVPEPAPLDVPRLTASASTPQPDAPGSLRFGREPPRVGDKTRTIVLARSVYDDPQSGPQSESYDSDFEEEVLAVHGPAAARVKVTFKTNEIFDNVASKPTVIQGKSYFVDVTSPNVLDVATQQPPSHDEITRVLDIVPDLGTRTGIDQVLPDRPLALRESRDDLAGAVLRILHPRFWSLTNGSAIFTRVDPQAGLADFDVRIAATSTNSGMAIELSGIVRIRYRDSKLGQFVLHGTYTRPNGEKGTLETSRLVPAVISP